MPRQLIHLGNTPGDGSGDGLRTALSKCEANFVELYEVQAASASQAELDDHVEDTNNPHNVTKGQVGLGNVDNTSDASKPISTATQAALNLKLNANDPSVTNSRTPTGGAGGVLSGSYPNPGFAVDMATQSELDAVSAQLPAKADLVGGKVPSSQLPSLALTDYLGAVSSQSAMLLLTAEPGDFCFRTDQGIAYFCVAGNGSLIAHWQAVSTPASVGVTSVNGHVGVVVLGKGDIDLGNVDNTSDASKPISTATQTALNGKAAVSHTHLQSDIGGLSSTIAGINSAIAGKANASHSHAIGDLPVASQTEAEAGTNTTKVMTPQRVAQAIAAQAGVVTDFGVIYVAANGNDTTGDGSPGKPYATIQKAWDAGRSGETLVARLGVGNFGSLAITGAVNPNLTLIGQGNHLSYITNISAVANLDMGGTLIIQGSGVDIGVLVTNVSSLTLTGPFRISFTAACRSTDPGGAGGSVGLFGGVTVASVDVSGLRGGDGDSETPSGSGGDGGSVVIDGSRVDNGCDTSGGPPGGDGGVGIGFYGMNGSTQLNNFSVMASAPTTATYVTASTVAGVFHASNTLP